MIAAATEIFKLSVNPTIGIVKISSELISTSSDTPDFSTPKIKADFLKYQDHAMYMYCCEVKLLLFDNPHFLNELNNLWCYFYPLYNLLNSTISENLLQHV